MEAHLRYYCQVTPGADTEYAYLRCLEGLGHGVRLLPIGTAYLQVPNIPEWRRWLEYAELLVAPMAMPYLNVVCSRPNVTLGVRMTGADFLPGAGSDEIVYDPSTAFGGLYTDGVPNIAIVSQGAKPPSEREIAALSRYELLACPTIEDSQALCDLGLSAEAIPPRYPEAWENVINELKTWD